MDDLQVLVFAVEMGMVQVCPYVHSSVRNLGGYEAVTSYYNEEESAFPPTLTEWLKVIHKYLDSAGEVESIQGRGYHFTAPLTKHWLSCFGKLRSL